MTLRQHKAAIIVRPGSAPEIFDPSPIKFVPTPAEIKALEGAICHVAPFEQKRGGG